MRSNVELIRALGVLTEAPGPEHARLADLLELGAAPDRESYVHVFHLQLYPYASVYTGAEGMLGGEARDRVAGAWSALGRTPPPEPDHLGALLGLYAALCEHAESETDPAENALWGAAASGFLWEHLLSWTTPYLDRFEGVGAPPYEAWACLLAEALHEEARRWGPPAVLPLHLRSAPGLPDPRRAGSDPFLSGILAPARSGMVLTRADLARASGDMGVGLRMGERRYALEAFFSQAPGETLDWLCGEAAAAARRHDDGPEDMALIAGFWSGRARAARDLLVSLRESDAPVIDRTEGVLQGSEEFDAGD